MRYLLEARLKAPPAERWTARLPAVRALGQQGLEFDDVTVFVGENGTGKSTVLEAIAAAWGFNPEGGSRNFHFSTRESHSGLWESLRLVKSAVRPRDGFFLRSESLYNVASEIERIDDDDPFHLMLDSYGGRSLHEMSHGEGVMSLAVNRFGSGLYIMDEPEAALSPLRQLALLSRMKELVGAGSQIIVATHSPIVMAYPDALVYLLDGEGIRRCDFRETEHFKIMKDFINAPERIAEML